MILPTIKRHSPLTLATCACGDFLNKSAWWKFTSLLIPGFPMKKPFMLMDRSKTGSSKMREQSCGTCSDPW